MTRSGQPGRTRIVGWILRLRVTSWSPARAPLCCADSRIARTRSLSLLPKLNSEPTPSSVESATPFNSRSEEHTSELQSLMRISYAVFCLKKKKKKNVKIQMDMHIHTITQEVQLT